MIGRPEGPRRWSFPLGLLGMLALIVGVERSLARRDLDFTTTWASAWKQASKEAKRQGPKRDVLAFGDSLVKEGVIPRLIEQGTGRSAVNLAVFKGQAPGNYFLLRRILDSGGHPSAILVDGELLDDDPRELTRLWPELIDIPEAFDLARTARDASFFGSIASARILPSIRARFEVRASLMAAFNGELPATRYEVYPALRNWRANGGAQVQPTLPPNPAIPGLLASTNYLPNEWHCHPLNASYVKRFLALAGSRNVPVYWLLPPLHDAVQDRRERGGQFGHQRDFLVGLQRRYPNLVVIDGRHSGYDPSTFYDLTHLNGRGASAFSAGVAEVLSARLGRPIGDARWLILPPFRERPIAGEDMTQSTVAMGSASAARR